MLLILALLVCVLFTPSQAWPWGCEGHETAALIAEHHLTAHARRMVHKMEAMGSDVLYYENIEGGHGGAADNARRPAAREGQAGDQ